LQQDTSNNSIQTLTKANFFIYKIELHYDRKEYNPISIIGFIPKNK